MKMQHADIPLESLAPIIEKIRKNIGLVFYSKQEVVDLVLTCLLSGGHLLIEDVPGVGKTTLAHALAISIGGTYRRIQFTSDMLPSDIIGVSIYDPTSQRFVFKPGPIFANIVLADEINRTSPKTQSALLEAMGEEQVSVEGETHPLPDPFLVIATQNSMEFYGTYPLPESELDRFFMCIEIGYPDSSMEMGIIAREMREDPVRHLKATVSPGETLLLRMEAERVRVDPSLSEYILSLAHRTRGSELLALGVSPRGAMYLHRAIRSYALIQGRSYVLPDDVKKLVLPIWSHRVVPSGAYTAPGSRKLARQVLKEIVEEFPVPL